MCFRLGTSPPRGTVGCATFPFRVGFRLFSRSPRHDGSLPEGFDFGFPCLRACVLLQFAFLRLAPPRHADDTREGFDGGWSCHSAFFVSPPPPHWRYAAGFDGWFAFLQCLRFLQLLYSRFSWLHSQAVQRCGSGFRGAASSIHGLVRGTGISPNFPYFCICGSSGWASVMVWPWKAGNYLRIR